MNTVTTSSAVEAGLRAARNQMVVTALRETCQAIIANGPPLTLWDRLRFRVEGAIVATIRKVGWKAINLADRIDGIPGFTTSKVPAWLPAL